MAKVNLNADLRSLTEFIEWLQRAKTGDVCVYYVGDLQYDRQVEVSDDEPAAEAKRAQVRALNALANAIMRMQQERNIILMQKRVGPSQWEYWAVRINGGQKPVRKEFKPRDQLLVA